MIKIEYITEETRSLLEQCGCHDVADELDDSETYITQEQAMRWLREERNYHITTFRINREDGDVYASVPTPFKVGYFKTYEEAAEYGIQMGCKYLLNNK